MFTGIVEDIGAVTAAVHGQGKSVLTIRSPRCVDDMSVGDSIAVNGVCLTVTTFTHDDFTVEAIPETLRLTSLGQLKEGDTVNLERAATAATRIGGHFVQGHVDGFTTIAKMEPDGDAIKTWFQKPDFYADCFVPKGYIGIDGMSLTIVDVTKDMFSICFIPHTQSVTVVKNYHPGTRVNVEIDHITKTVDHILRQRGLHG